MKRLLRKVVGFAVQNRPEAFDRILKLDIASGKPGISFRNEHRLGKEMLDLAGAVDRQPVRLGNFVDPQNRDNILKIAIMLENALNLARDAIMFLADDIRIENPRRRGQRVDRRINRRQIGRASCRERV